MKNLIYRTAILGLIPVMFSGCARDLSSNVYVSSSTLSLTLEGQVISVRPVVVKENDKLGNNAGGMLVGGAGGAVLGASTGSGKGAVLGAVGGALLGGALGGLVEGQLSKSSGYEYIVKVDTSKLNAKYYEGNAAMRNAISAATTSGVITIVQGADTLLNVGQKVYVIFSDDRVRVIAA